MRCGSGDYHMGAWAVNRVGLGSMNFDAFISYANQRKAAALRTKYNLDEAPKP